MTFQRPQRRLKNVFQPSSKTRLTWSEWENKDPILARLKSSGVESYKVLIMVREHAYRLFEDLYNSGKASEQTMRAALDESLRREGLIK